jgi:GNAT superfamily N-acetyltransferase
MKIAVTSLDPADEAAATQAYEIVATAVAADLPDYPPYGQRRFLAELRNPWPGDDHRLVLAHLDGVPAGYLTMHLPMLDNLDNADVEITVHPAHRRHGVGRTLYEYAVSVIRELGRKRISGMAVAALPGGVSRDPAGGEFAAALGAKNALEEVRRRLDVTAVDEAALDTQLAAAWERAAGYSLVQWRGPCPEEYVDDVAYLDGRLLADAPMGELEWEPEKVNAEKVRAIEEVCEARGRRRYHSGVRHDASGRLVAWSFLDFPGNVDWHAFQQITLVEPSHRGRRLGTIVKIENLRHARTHEPAVRVIDTWNAAVNDHMISINEAMGFRAVDAWQNWQLSV